MRMVRNSESLKSQLWDVQMLLSRNYSGPALDQLKTANQLSLTTSTRASERGLQ